MAKGRTPAKSGQGRTSGRTTQSRTPSRTSVRNNGQQGMTKEQLLTQAKRMGITGISRMTKDQLQRAVSRVK